MKNMFSSIKRLLGNTTVIDEATMTVKKRSFIKITLIFLLVFFIGSMLSNFLWGIPTTVHLMNDEAFLESYMGGSMDEAALNQAISDAMNSLPDWMSSFELIMTVGIIVACIGYCTKYERRRLFTMGFVKKGAIKEYAVGLIIGLAMFGAVFGLLYICGDVKEIRFNQNLSVITLISFFVGFLVQGMSEEVLFRGYYMISAATTGNIPLAVFGSSLLFALVHLGNPGVNAIGMINVFLFGIFAALYLLRRGSIWGIAALHSMWNFAQGNIFGLSVSGSNVKDSLFITNSDIDNLFNGGAFGPEGGLMVTLVLVGGILVLMSMKNKDIVPEIDFGKEFYSAF